MVISIIGVLSSIVLVSFSGSRDKARLAKAQNFDAQISHALGAYAVGIWRFEESSGIDIHDESGYGNDGTFYGNPTPVYPAGVYPGTTALEFDGFDDYVGISTNASFSGLQQGTIELWLKPNENNNICFMYGSGTSDYIRIDIIGEDFTFVQEVGNFAVTSIHSDDLVSYGNWYHIVVTQAGSSAQMYINGIAQNHSGQTNSGNWFADSTTSGAIKLGESSWGGYEYNGAIDNVAIYDEALSSAQIQQHYAAGAASHGIAINDN